MKFKITTNRLNKFKEGDIVEATEIDKELLRLMMMLLDNGEAVYMEDAPIKNISDSVIKRVKKTLKKITKK